jgi:hypothetical protein
MLRLILASVVFLAVSCCSPPPKGPVVENPTCATACENADDLGCGVTDECVRACDVVQQSGIAEIDVACASNAASCAEIQACGGFAR